MTLIIQVTKLLLNYSVYTSIVDYFFFNLNHNHNTANFNKKKKFYLETILKLKLLFLTNFLQKKIVIIQKQTNKLINTFFDNFLILFVNIFYKNLFLDFKK